MRTYHNIRTALAALAVSGVVAAASPASGQAVVQAKPDSAVTDFHKFLPPLPSVPWLEAKRRVPNITITALPEAGSVTALLLMPEPAMSWGVGGNSQAASANIGFVGM